MHRGQSLVAFGLHTLVVAQQGPHLAQHRHGLRAAAAGGGEVIAVLGGLAEGIGVVGLGQDDSGGELGLERVGGVQRGDRGDGNVVARGAGVGRGGDGRGQAGAEGGEDLAGDGVGEVGESVHEDCCRLMWKRANRWLL